MPLPELEDNPDEYEVEEIRDKAVMKGKVYYLIKQAGWLSEYNLWIKEGELGNAQGAIKDFEKSQKRKRAQTLLLFSPGET